MNEEEKFDELLSSKLSERDFPFDELNWDEAESLLIQQEKRAKFTRVALTFAAGLAAGACAPARLRKSVAILANTNAARASATLRNLIIKPPNATFKICSIRCEF